MMLWILIAVLTAGAALAVLIPLRRPVEHASDRRADQAVYKEQLAAIDAELKRGLIDAEAAEAARTETARRLLAAAEAEKETTAVSSSRYRVRAAQLLAICFTPVAALGLYMVLGSPDLPDQPLAGRLNAPMENQSVDVLVAQVERHLADNPEDGQGWAVIAPVYMSMGQPLRSAQAYANALRLLGPNAEWFTELGEALTVANEGMITSDARSAFEQAVELDSAPVKPRFFLALALSQEGKAEAAAEAWTSLLDGADERAAWVPVARAELAKLRGEAPPSETGPAVEQPAGPTAEDVAAAGEMMPDEREVMIRSMVSGLAARIDQNGGSEAEWSQLIRSYMVLGDQGKAEATLKSAEEALANNPDALSGVRNTASKLGLTGS
ncbi:c-type cytochrome biogenesis protein CcmI [Roseibium denhamense]|uniref:Cytochrome c-type biogenesis protein CcmH n=1 Tax=Roseibium denhamense TaxID=76305 RepID=A0ABY1PLS7_9HYPH|nr:c-type cytochrome biogenesis protein CcmI [Roseibium denhamense]MTI05740.1 c-type cytochrome biogenesis protein CcmI [Roseibium denhamense]SMP36972.1 cytochrome c-type biogenesis protein CcmH [Roseibium denhamense]